MELAKKLYASKSKISLVGGVAIGKIGMAAKLSKHRKGERTNPKLSLVAKFLETLLVTPGSIAIYACENGIYCEIEGNGYWCVNDTIKTLVTNEDKSLLPVMEENMVYASIMKELVSGSNSELQDVFAKIVSEYAEFEAADSGDIFLMCDSFYYGTAKNKVLEDKGTVTESELEAAFRSGYFKPALRIADKFLTSSKFFKEDSIEIKAEGDVDFLQECKNGKYHISYSWDEEQKEYIQSASFLDGFEILPAFESLVKKIKFRSDKILERMDIGLEGLEALQKDVINCMMLGKPGTGKSTIVYAISAALGIPVYTIVFSKNTDESVAEGRNAIVNGKPQFVETEIPKFWGRGGIFLFEEPNLALADVTMGVFGQALEYPYVIFKNGYERIERHPLSMVIACENVGIAGTKANSPAFSNRFKQKYILDDPTRDTFIRILRKAKNVDEEVCEWVYDAYESTVQYLRDPDINEEDIVNVLSMRTCIGAIENMEEGESPKEALRNTIGGAVAECDLEVSRNLVRECIDALPDAKFSF